MSEHAGYWLFFAKYFANLTQRAYIGNGEEPCFILGGNVWCYLALLGRHFDFLVTSV